MTLVALDIAFSYNSHSILSDMSFNLDPRTVMCILGVNGAGKSTLLKCLNRILTPQSGSVFVDGKNLLGMKQSQVAQKIGYVPQNHEKMRLSVFDVVLMGRRSYIRWGIISEDYLYVEMMLEKVGIAHLAMRSVCDLSGGEIQKVAIARALVQSPEVLLLDEPTSNLDLKGQLDVMGLVKKMVVSQGIAAVIAIHDLNIALRFANRFLFIKDHRIHGIYRKKSLHSKLIYEVYGVRVDLVTIGAHTMVVPV